MEITVITPTIPGRESQVAEAEMSVRAQTYQAKIHLMILDEDLEGPAAVRNEALRMADTEWVAFLDDDDLMDPHHLETLVNESEADVRGSYCRFPYRTIPPQYINRPYDRKTMRQHGIFGITVLARRDLILEAGGFGSERYEDWELWNRMADRGATFEILPIVTWCYRLSDGSRTFG